MAEPAQLHVGSADDAAHMLNGVPRLGCQARLDTIDHAADNRYGGLPDDPEDRQGDQQSDDRFGQRQAEPHPDRAEHDGEAGQAVDAGMGPIGDQGRAVDPAAPPDAEYGHGLVADEADDAGRHDPSEQPYGLRMQELVDGLVAGEKRAREDDEDDDDASEILDLAVAVVEGRRRLAAHQAEGDPERD